MKFATGPILGAIFTILAAAGFNLSEDVQALVLDNADYVVNGILGLLAAWTLYKSKQPKEPPGPDEHSQIHLPSKTTNKSQEGFAHKGLLMVMGAVAAAVLAAGCASTAQKQLSLDQRAAAVLIDARVAAETCDSLWEAKRLSDAGAIACVNYVGSSIQTANLVRFIVLTGKEEEKVGLEGQLIQAEGLIKTLQSLLKEVPPAPVEIEPELEGVAG